MSVFLFRSDEGLLQLYDILKLLLYIFVLFLFRWIKALRTLMWWKQVSWQEQTLTTIKDVFEAIATGNFVSCSLGYEGVWLMHSQAYSYHCISITAACSVGATEVITSVYYIMPTILVLILSIIRGNC